MQLPEMKRSYTWGALINFEVGPRREITLSIRRYPSDLNDRHSHKWKENRDATPVDSIRFGGIENFEEVKTFFESMKNSKRTKRGTPMVDWISYDQQHKSKLGHLFIKIFFDWPGIGITIECSSITESEAES